MGGQRLRLTGPLKFFKARPNEVGMTRSNHSLQQKVKLGGFRPGLNTKPLLYPAFQMGGRKCRKDCYRKITLKRTVKGKHPAVTGSENQGMKRKRGKEKEIKLN